MSIKLFWFTKILMFHYILHILLNAYLTSGNNSMVIPIYCESEYKYRHSRTFTYAHSCDQTHILLYYEHF
jgi:hypothetical protein